MIWFKIIYAASTYDLAVNIIMVITFGIHDLLVNYLCY